MTESLHPAASHHLPSFITAPGETDVLMVVMGVFLVLAVLMFGVLFLHLHTLPERVAHKSKKVQFEIVAILGLLALFTHMHIFWVAGLLLAFIDFPDLGGFLRRIAGSVEKIAGMEPGQGAGEIASETSAATSQNDEAAAAGSEAGTRPWKGTVPDPSPTKAKAAPARQKETVGA